MHGLKFLMQAMVGLLAVSLLPFLECRKIDDNKKAASGNAVHTDPTPRSPTIKDSLQLDTAHYNERLLYLAHNHPTNKWPVKTIYPLNGAILPFKRIVTYYGNFYSSGMGILGELPPDLMLEKLQGEAKKWEAADTLTPVLPALQYIVVTAQRNPGRDRKYRLRMPFSQVDKALKLAERIKGILFLDVQVGHSTLQQELPYLLPYLKLSNVHLAIDPEYSMKGGEVPCSKIGSFDAADINFASSYLAQIVRDNSIPPKVLVVHRFTKQMVTNYKKITTCPEVQVVMDMDGFGYPAKKIDSYRSWISNEPVQFTGFKIFYKNDVLTSPSRKVMSPGEVLKLYPSPIYIQYQ